VLAAWGMTTEGGPVLVGLEPGASESTDAWSGFLDGMVTRGLRPPLLVISDGAPGLIAAVELVFAHSLRQRCVIHRARNVLAKVPVEFQAEVKKAYWALFDDTGTEPGDAAIAVVRERAERFAATYATQFPSAVDCLMADLSSLTTYLRFPAGHHARIRHSNFIERTFGETRRRVKVIGRLPGERTCLGLVWAVLDRASRGWRGVVMTPAAVRQLQDVRRQLFNPTTVEDVPTESTEAVTTAA
jgi:transposase-like protein